MLYRVETGLIGFLCRIASVRGFAFKSTSSNEVWSCWYEFYMALLGFTEFYRVKLSFTEFYQVLPSFFFFPIGIRMIDTGVMAVARTSDRLFFLDSDCVFFSFPKNERQVLPIASVRMT